METRMVLRAKFIRKSARNRVFIISKSILIEVISSSVWEPRFIFETLNICLWNKLNQTFSASNFNNENPLLF